MKKMKRILTLMLTVCLMLPCFSTVSQAADGIIFFTDLETAVGETFTVTGTVVTKNDVLGDATVQMSYDSSYIRFVEGEGVTKNSDGQLTFTGSGDGSSDRVEFDMKFQALQEGSTRMDQESATVTNANGVSVTCENGYADITIAEGDPSLIQPETTETSGDVVIDGASYSIDTSFSDNVIPTGFVSGEVTYQEQGYTGIVQENGDVQGLYLTNESGAGAFYLYDSTSDTFYPCEEILISEECSIIVLADTADVQLSDDYTEASISINGTSFPVWLAPEREGFYVLYALNSNGEKGLYLYDSEEHTYQRMEMPEVSVANTEETKADMWTKISDFVTENFVWVLVGVVCTFVVGLILIIVLAVKLRHRNLELDDLYDEYGIDLDDEVDAHKKKSGKNPKKKGDDDFEDEFDDDFEDEYLDYYDDDEYEDDYDNEYEEDAYDDEKYEDDYLEEDDLKELRDAFGDNANQKKYDDYYDDDDFDEDEASDDLKNSVNTDTFEMDFIDFD